MNVDALDRILAAEETVTPSPRFAANAMAAVRREAATPPPIAFPWRRALPGIVVCGGALAAGLAAAIVGAGLAALADTAALPSTAGAGSLSSVLAWTAVGLGGTFLLSRWILRTAELPD